MKIAKTNFTVGEFTFDKGMEVVLPKELMEGVKDLVEDAVPVKEKQNPMTMVKDKMMKAIKNK